MDPFTKFIEWIKLKPLYLFALAVLSGLLLFLPETILINIGINQITTQYQQWIGILFVFSFIFWGVYIIDEARKIIISWWKNKKIMKQRQKYLKNLTKEEKEILHAYIHKNTKTNYYKLDNGIVSGLVHNEILYLSTQAFHPSSVPYNMQPWAWEYLNENTELLK